MKYIHNETKQIFNNEEEFRQSYPNVSFPVVLDYYALEYANVSEVVETLEPTPSFLERTQYDGVQFINGKWIEVWSIVSRYDDPILQKELEEDLKQQQADAIITEWQNIKTLRNDALSQTDFIFLLDAIPVTDECKQAFIKYRQLLRDITLQPDPYNITWPVIPEYKKAI
jgi:hypothetical protein